MLKEVSISSLKPNPFRRLDEYPIIREKVDALKESIGSTGFWGTIVARPASKGYEIAFGHHRLIALQESLGAGKRVEVIVRELSNEQMIQMMARENMEEYGTSAWVELETIRAVIEAYGAGDIELPKVPKDTPAKHIRHVQQTAVERPYTRLTVAAFLGWTRADGELPNYACEVAFKALDLIDAGFLKEKDLRGLNRAQMDELVKGQWSIYQANLRIAEANKKDAKAAEKKAAEADSPAERRRFEKRAAVHREQAEVFERGAKKDAADFGKRGAELLRKGEASVRDIRAMADERKPSMDNGATKGIDDLAEHICRLLSKTANDDGIATHFTTIKKHVDDLSPKAGAALDREFIRLIGRLEKMRDALKAFV